MKNPIHSILHGLSSDMKTIPGSMMQRACSKV